MLYSLEKQVLKLSLAPEEFEALAKDIGLYKNEFFDELRLFGQQQAAWPASRDVFLWVQGTTRGVSFRDVKKLDVIPGGKLVYSPIPEYPEGGIIRSGNGLYLYCLKLRE